MKQYSDVGFLYILHDATCVAIREEIGIIEWKRIYCRKKERLYLH